MPDTTPKPNELDVLIVKNTDVDCNVIDSENRYPHSEYFQVKWGGKPHRIAPGQTKKMPRFLAEHFAKHLADHILFKLEDQTKKRGLINSPVERPRVISEILLGVDTYFGSDEDTSVTEPVDTGMPEERAMDLGEVPNPLMGVLKGNASVTSPLPDSVPVQAKSEEKVSIWDDDKPKPAREQLLADCDKLGIEITGKESDDQLIDKIKAF
jgi:hypothetical protein